MKIPRVVQIGGHPIGVSFATSKTISNPGEYNGYHQSIVIRRDDDVREDVMAEVLLHEILEAIVHIYNLKDIEHTALTVLSETLFAVIRANKLDWRKEN